MKKFVFTLLCVSCMLPFFVNSAFANEGYAVHPQQFLPANIISLLSGNSSIFLLDHDPIDGNVRYVSWVSFDYLSELSTDWGSAGVIVYNSTMKAYFIRVSFTPTVSETGGLEYCSLGTANGFLLGAKDGGFPSTSQDEYMKSYEKHWVKWSNPSSYHSLNIVSYDALCQIVLDLDSVQQPAGICRVSANGNVYYVVMSTGSFTCPVVENGIEYVFANTGWYYCSPDSAVFATKASDADALSAINSLCTQIHAKISSLLTTCNTISTKLDTLTSVISNGKVLVDNSDVVSAIQSIPAFDDTELLDRVGTIVEQIDTLSRKIDLNYFPNMYKKVASIADTFGNTNKHLITGNRHTSEIIDMLTAAVDADTGKLLVADTAVTSAIADLTDSLSVPTGKCAHDWQLTSTGQPGTPAVTNVRLPAEYQEVEYLENTSEGAYINTGAVPSLSGTKFHIKYQMLSGSYLFGCGQVPRLACFMNTNAIQVYLGNTSLSGIVGYTKTGLYSNIVDLAGFLTGAETGRYVDVTADGVTSRVTPPDGAISGSFSDSLPFYLFAWRYGDTLRSGTGRIWGFSMEVGGNLVRDMVPCYRKADNVPGMYDLVSSSFSINAGTGSFVTGADVPVTIITPEVPTTYDTYTCSICGEEYIDSDSTGAPEVTGVTIPFTRWFHGKFQEYEASLLSAIDAIPAYDDAAVIAAIQSIPAPTDYTSQLTAVVEKLDALANKPAVDLTTIESTLSTISDKLDNTASDVNNTIINITNDNDYFSVFYITDGDGNTRSVTDFAGALTGASGKLLSLLYRLVFADALGSVDGDLGNMEDFFTSEEPPPTTAAMNGDTAPANEVIDVWAS